LAVKLRYDPRPDWPRDGVLPDERFDEVVAAVLSEIASLGFDVLGRVPSPLRGHAGNAELFVHFKKTA
jgi:predicted rRNA methylase YqxC with S4 and FtsJ domains